MKILKKLLAVFALLLVFPVLVFLISQAAKFISKASVLPANIVIDANSSQGKFVPNWQGFSQGGESAENMFKPAVSQIASLKPKFIRIDHIYDFYNVVSRGPSNNLILNFEKLDDVVYDILKTGAQPFFSLSYMPSAISSGDIISSPRSFAEWSIVVRKTIEHYSGKNGMNLKDVYYEVWNEPDLFGNYKYYGEKNYLELYRHAAIGAENAQNVNVFRLGGPSTASYYPAWMSAFLQFVKDNKLKFDFLSWHRYSTDTNLFLDDALKLDSLLNTFPEYKNVERIISEAGYNSEVHPGYDTLFSAYHTASLFAKLKGKVYQVFPFELIDGLSPKGEIYWGRWGLMTHPSKGLVLKPRYFLWNVLNLFEGELLQSSGENDFVNVVPLKNGDSYKILIVNFSADDTRVENVPISLLNILPGEYNYRLSYPLVSKTFFTNLNLVLVGQFKTQVLMDHNSLAVVDLIKK